MGNSRKEYRIGRIRLKFKKYNYGHGYIISVFYISAFIIRTFLNLIFLKLNILLSSKKQKPERVLFIEPPQQGYGDLLFQTPLFFILKKNGFTVDVLIQQKHAAILNNNPNIGNVSYWNENGISGVLRKKHDIIMGLGRDKIRTNILMFLKSLSEKIIPDADIKSWHETFTKNNPSAAWQIIIFGNFLNSFSVERPKIYFSEEELKKIGQENNNSDNSILFIAGVDDKLKRYPFWDEVIETIDDDYKIQLLNPNNNLINSIKDREISVIKTSTYREAILAVAKTKIIVGAEGSLIHVAAALGKKIVVLDADFPFQKQS